MRNSGGGNCIGHCKKDNDVTNVTNVTDVKETLQVQIDQLKGELKRTRADLATLQKERLSKSNERIDRIERFEKIIVAKQLTQRRILENLHLVRRLLNNLSK